MQLLDMKTMVCEMRTTLFGIDSRLNAAEESVSQHEATAMETTPKRNTQRKQN